jgi:hypothetical protein
MDETFGSTCHGAGRAQSRNASRKKLEYQEVLHVVDPFMMLLFWCVGAVSGACLPVKD